MVIVHAFSSEDSRKENEVSGLIHACARFIRPSTCPCPPTRQWVPGAKPTGSCGDERNTIEYLTMAWLRMIPIDQGYPRRSFRIRDWDLLSLALRRFLRCRKFVRLLISLINLAWLYQLRMKPHWDNITRKLFVIARHLSSKEAPTPVDSTHSPAQNPLGSSHIDAIIQRLLILTRA